MRSMRDDKRTWSATELIRLLGTGSYGSVYQGVCEGEKVAVKVLQLVAGSEADINNELRQLRGCDHENIIAYRDAFVGKTQQVIAQPATRLAPAPKALWVVMEYCEAGSCLDVMRERGRGFDEPCVAHISCCVLRGLDYLHTQRKVIHRDIKAANVLLNARGEVKLADLGIVAQLQNTMSKRGTMIGTPHWMAPRSVDDPEYSSARWWAAVRLGDAAPEALSHAAGICEGGYGTAVDVWSLGITVIELSERDPPFFDASSVYGAMLRIVQGPPAKCRALEAQVEDAVA
ncbi:putative Serine/threonine-protein kinase [Emiliania huxleyi CCMP1516]|uniref:non-specific serine/threonine protein kinase n=2 Tax=Emiliania huxleyi TaxID=2903 RepID=A0A0D3INN8_EMIH1|nr:putative Serine/threonine-protein kinase [Emiliania huxleyi CCMP1516]EOD12873.1 putative Serine/threonine-protein kinase [Emiliania huxleyi CCMP1516]|eukprot:XP_005765302.1 putative Serine/threonine-protein kinase [Emiliania huxleyi CCMP1516]